MKKINNLIKYVYLFVASVGGVLAQGPHSAATDFSFESNKRFMLAMNIADTLCSAREQQKQFFIFGSLSDSIDPDLQQVGGLISADAMRGCNKVLQQSSVHTKKFGLEYPDLPLTQEELKLCFDFAQANQDAQVAQITAENAGAWAARAAQAAAIANTVAFAHTNPVAHAAALIQVAKTAKTAANDAIITSAQAIVHAKTAKVAAFEEIVRTLQAANVSKIIQALQDVAGETNMEKHGVKRDLEETQVNCPTGNVLNADSQHTRNEEDEEWINNMFNSAELSMIAAVNAPSVSKSSSSATSNIEIGNQQSAPYTDDEDFPGLVEALAQSLLDCNAEVLKTGQILQSHVNDKEITFSVEAVLGDGRCGFYSLEIDFDYYYFILKEHLRMKDPRKVMSIRNLLYANVDSLARLPSQKKFETIANKLTDYKNKLGELIMESQFDVLKTANVCSEIIDGLLLNYRSLLYMTSEDMRMIAHLRSEDIYVWSYKDGGLELNLAFGPVLDFGVNLNTPTDDILAKMQSHVKIKEKEFLQNPTASNIRHVVYTRGNHYDRLRFQGIQTVLPSS